MTKDDELVKCDLYPQTDSKLVGLWPTLGHPTLIKYSMHVKVMHVYESPIEVYWQF